MLLGSDLAYAPGCLVGGLLNDVALRLCWINFACPPSGCCLLVLQLMGFALLGMLFALGLGLNFTLGHSCCNLVRVSQRKASLFFA